MPGKNSLNGKKSLIEIMKAKNIFNYSEFFFAFYN
jgi:hypothetical protein